MKFGLAFGSSIAAEGPQALALCKQAEALGFDSVWGGEHVIRPVSIESKYPYTPDGTAPGDHDTPVPDPLVWLAYVAAAAPPLRLGTCILIVPQRNPLVFAKELATLDRLSGGRVELGIGVGWMKEEFDALGIGWERRGASRRVPGRRLLPGHHRPREAHGSRHRSRPGLPRSRSGSK